MNKLPCLSTETFNGLRTLIDTTTRVIRQLKVAGSPTQHWDHILVYSLIMRMPPRTLSFWENSQELDEMPSLDTVLKFLKLKKRERAAAKISLKQSTTKGKRRSRNRNKRRQLSRVAASRNHSKANPNPKIQSRKRQLRATTAATLIQCSVAKNSKTCQSKQEEIECAN